MTLCSTSSPAVRIHLAGEVSRKPWPPEEEIAKYDSIYIAVDAATDWHCDKKNIGRSIVTALGDYTGGELKMKTTRRLFQCQICLEGGKGPEFCRKEELHSDPDGVYA